MEVSNCTYPLARYRYDPSVYYAYGNTTPRDFLQNITTVKRPSVLVLGCGDIRSCFYSLWKNFDVKGSSRFDGVHFTLNDINAAVHARNILLLYLCLQMPEEETAARKWLSGMWAIWYCHELYQDHYDMLNASLHTLCSYSKSWASEDNPLYPLVQFSSPSTIEDVSLKWKMWLDQDIGVTSIKEMRRARQERFHLDPDWNAKDYASKLAEGITEIPYDNTMNDLQQQKLEVLTYYTNGSVYAESVLELDPPNTKRFINCTLYEKHDGKYTLDATSLPYSCYFQLMEFKPDKSCFPVSTQLWVQDENFMKRPFLANSVQQFSLWLHASHKVLRSEYKLKLLFTFDCSDALTFCHKVERACQPQLFDLIYTSNLIDHLGPANLILSAIPLLKENGLLFTATLLNVTVHSHDEFLAHCFGVNCKFFPLLFGIRCVNYEGKEYKSPVPIKPNPLTLKTATDNLLIWEKLPSDTIPLVLPVTSKKPLTNVLANALHSTICVSANIFSKRTFELQLKLAIDRFGIETAIKVIQVFMSRTSADFNPDFWKPLTNLMRKNKDLKPYLSHFQTHLLLHGIHMHLTVSENDCPICTGSCLSQSIGLFSKTMEEPPDVSLKFLAIVHKENINEADQLLFQAAERYHIFDCVSPSTSDVKTLSLYFYSPLKLVYEGYNITMITVPEIMASNVCPLKSLLIPFTKFKFSQAPELNRNEVQLHSFGSIISHVSDGDSSDVKIALLQDIVDSSSNLRPCTQSILYNVLQISYGKHTCEIKYPYPIKSKHSISLNGCQLHIQSHRSAHKFEEEKPLFVISPEKELSLSPVNLRMNVIKSYCAQQFTMGEMETTKTPMVKVKDSLSKLFMSNKSFVKFVNSKNEVLMLILVNQRLCDYESNYLVPVIDLAFCCQASVELVITSWKKMVNEELTIKLNNEYCLMKAVFLYFATRTYGTDIAFDSNSRISCLAKEGIQKHFTRAVVFPLLWYPDYRKDYFYACKRWEFLNSTYSEANPVQCSYCSFISDSLKKCQQCKQVQYCDKDCQKRHWSKHKKECTKFLHSSTGVDKVKCGYCGIISDSLKCGRCKQVQHCAEDFQIKHWPEHKKECKKFSTEDDKVKCGYYGIISDSLKKLGQCKQVQYRAEDFQIKHWPEHKKECKKFSHSLTEDDKVKCGFCGITSASAVLQPDQALAQARD